MFWSYNRWGWGKGSSFNRWWCCGFPFWLKSFEEKPWNLQQKVGKMLPPNVVDASFWVKTTPTQLDTTFEWYNVPLMPAPRFWSTTKRCLATLVGFGFHLKFREVFCIWDVQNLANNGINYLSAGEGLEPSTVGLSAEKFNQCHLKNWTTGRVLLSFWNGPTVYGTC